MIDQVSGKIISINENYVVLAVGGLGIKVNISAAFASKLVNEDLINSHDDVNQVFSNFSVSE